MGEYCPLCYIPVWYTERYTSDFLLFWLFLLLERQIMMRKMAPFTVDTFYIVTRTHSFPERGPKFFYQQDPIFCHIYPYQGVLINVTNSW